MNPSIPLSQSVGARLAVMVLILFLSSVVAGLVAVQTLGQLHGLAEANFRQSRVRASSSWVAHLAGRLLTEDADDRSRTARELIQAIQDVRQHINSLRESTTTSGWNQNSRRRDSEIAETLERAWSGQLQGHVDTLASTSDRARALVALRSLDEGVRELADLLARNASANLELVGDASRRFQFVIYAVLALIIGATGAILVAARRIMSATVQLARAAQRIANGDTAALVPATGNDELALLGRSLAQMSQSLIRTIAGERAARERLEHLLESATQTADGLTTAASQIRTGTSQQATGAQVQISAIAQTMATVEGVLQISDKAADWARTVADLSFRSVETGKRGRRSVEDTVAGMERLQDHVESIAESILALSERAQAIGEIIATVNELTDQTNLLALNAAIEASRAGEQGKGFAVVASEIKTLADQSKKATAQIRQILGEIQRATSTAVATSETGTQMVATAIEVAHQAGEVIKSLGDSIDEAAQAASQIASSADQQAAGIAQISLGIKNINQVTTQNLSAVRLAEETVHELTQMGIRLKELLSR